VKNVTAYFLDSSAGVKLYRWEIGSNRVLDIADPLNENELFVAEFTIVEISAALYRSVRGGGMRSDEALKAVRALRNDFSSSFFTIDIGAALIDDALHVAERRGLRGYDCLQLASALTIDRTRRAAGSSSIVLLSADLELNEAARAEGFTVENPNDYP
jgi:predicted nucleic acid-binding protein